VSSVPILYQDDDILVVNKPAGILSVPGNNPADGLSVIEILKPDFPDARAAHRLDMATSGLLIIALGKHALVHISNQFQVRTVDKTYHALVYGTPSHTNGIINAPLICDYPNRPKQKLCHDIGKPSITEWKVIDKIDTQKTLLELKPRTGRSHQLRVHCASIGHPIIGDYFYADDTALSLSDRLELYAVYLSFIHPVTNEKMEFNAPSPYA
jgi:tRNA pseudouridine32 synthase/23S rRNA pseudouridine746 synthase